MSSGDLTSATVLGAVDRDRLVTFARRVTGTPYVNDIEGPRAQVIAELLDHPRLDVHVDPVVPNRPNVIVRLRGTGEAPGLLLNGHIDARWYPHGWRHDPLDPWLEDGRLHGAGISDMLGGLASMMEALRAAADLPPLPGDLVLLANMWHDSNGLGTKYALATSDTWPAFGINGDPTALSILSRHGGCIKFEIKFRGRTAHVSRQAEGADALAAAAAVHGALRAARLTHTPDPALPGMPVLQVGILRAGFAAAAVADEAIIQGDVRTVPGMTWASFRADVEAIVAECCPPGVTARLNCLVRQHPFTGTTSGRLFGALGAAHREVMGRAVEVDTHRAAQRFVLDATDMARAGIETLVYGPATWRFGPNEFIEVDEMANATRVYLATAIRLMRIDRSSDQGTPTEETHS